MLELTMTVLLAAQSSAELYRDLQKLNVVGSALYVAAHPDDENTRLLATLANETKVRTAYLSLTHGEGGQNLIGTEIGPLLGLIRTQELLAARRIDGAEQYFTRAADFGYSKSVDETLAKWDHDGVLSDVVGVIRKLKPDVIITRFNLEGGDTHGHHTASARLALEAFKAAADPAFHPETGAPWQAKRIFWNSWESKVAGIPFDTSVYSPLLGTTYGELAALSRSQHKSQGFGAAPLHGPSIENFVLLAGDPAKTLFDGVDLTWKRVPNSAALQKLLDQALKEFKLDKPSASVPVLLKVLAELRKLKQDDTAVTKLIADCAGVFVEASAGQHTVVQDAPLEVTTTALVRAADAPLKLKHVVLPDGQTVQPGKATIKASGELKADFVFEQGLTVTRPIELKWVDPTVGERYRPVAIVPATTLKPDAQLLIFTDDKPKALKVVTTDHATGKTSEATQQVKAESGPLDLGGQTLTRIEYGHIPFQTILAPAVVNRVRFELQRGKVNKVGYIMGAGDDVPQALRQVGYEVTLLDDETLRSKPLNGFDAIVVGIRAFNTNPKLPTVRARLMEYVERGGTLLVQYNTKNRLSDVPAEIGPWPFEISHDRVTDETAEVVLEPKTLQFSKPNALTAKDFDGWVQERGLYFANKWDEKYATPMSMHDPGEQPLKGALLIGKHGKGTFIYTGLSFFRQLPAGVPGAYRLFANLLANGR